MFSKRCFYFNIILISSAYSYDYEDLIDVANKSYHRSSFCSIHQKVERGEIALENALEGKIITIGTQYELNEENPSLPMKILKEVAQRAKFEYIPYRTQLPHKNESWTDVLLRDTRRYDLAVDWWVRTTPRLTQGIVYPETWYDADFIMVAKPMKEKEIFVLSLSKPFSLGLWILTFAAIIITAVVFFFLEDLHTNVESKSILSSIEICIFSSAYSYAGSRSVFNPKSRASMVLVISMAFLYLILVSTYTAKLTNDIVKKTKSALFIKDVSDVVRYDLLVCVQRGLLKEDIFRRLDKDSRILEVETEEEIVLYLSENKCDVGVLSKGGFQLLKGDDDFNKKCNIEWVGHRVFTSGASFALADSEELCSSLLDSVLDFYLFQLKLEKEIDEIFEDFRYLNFATTCDLVSTGENIVKPRFSAASLYAIFTIHLCFIIMAILKGYFDFVSEPKEIKEKIKDKFFSLRTFFRTEDQSVILERKNSSPTIKNNHSSNKNGKILVSKLERGRDSLSLSFFDEFIAHTADLLQLLDRQNSIEHKVLKETEEIKKALRKSFKDC